MVCWCRKNYTAVAGRHFGATSGPETYIIYKYIIIHTVHKPIIISYIILTTGNYVKSVLLYTHTRPHWYQVRLFSYSNRITVTVLDSLANQSDLPLKQEPTPSLPCRSARRSGNRIYIYIYTRSLKYIL